MKNSKLIKKITSISLTLAMLMSTLVVSPCLDAAKSPYLNKKKAIIEVGDSFKLNVMNSNRKATVKWKSSKKSVAAITSSINMGKKARATIIGKKKGTATITATYKFNRKTRKLKCKVVVKKTVAAMQKPVVTVPVADNNIPAQNVTATPVVKPTAALVAEPTAEPAEQVTAEPTAASVAEPTAEATAEPITEPSTAPTSAPTEEPADKPTAAPTEEPGKDEYENAEWKASGYKINDLFSEYFMCGVGTDMSNLMYNETSELIKYHFGSVSMRTETKLESIYKGDFDRLGEILSYCKENGLKFRYDSILSFDYQWSIDFIYQYLGSKDSGMDEETIKNNLRDYINQIIEYIYSNGYGDVVYAYNVVNEVASNGNSTHTYYLNEDATSMDDILSTTGTGVSLRIGDIMEKFLGPEGIYLAFLDTYSAIEVNYEKYREQFGYKNKPSLIYNDYILNESNYLAIVKYINAACNLEKNTEGIRYCDGVGFESHGVEVSVQERMIKALADEGYEVQITELDERTDGEEQAGNIKALYNLYKKYSKKGEYGKTQGDSYTGVTSVCLYGLYDGEVGFSKNIFSMNNETLKPKPAFYGILQAGGVSCGDKEY